MLLLSLLSLLSLLNCEEGGICAKGGMRKSRSSGSIGSEEAWEASEDGKGDDNEDEDDCECIRGLFDPFSLPLVVEVGGRFFESLPWLGHQHRFPR